MNQRLISEIGRSQRIHIVNRLKRSDGLSVPQLAGMLKMSYMGVKQHCIALQKDGYLDTWRRPGGVGRPEMVYRLTRRAHELFPVESHGLTMDLLEAAKQLHGAAAPEKLLLVVFGRIEQRLAARMRGETPAEKIKALARLRDADGYMAEADEQDGVLRIVEFHSPIMDLVRVYPIIARLESEMFGRLLGAKVKREDRTVSGLYRCVFEILR